MPKCLYSSYFKKGTGLKLNAVTHLQSIYIPSFNKRKEKRSPSRFSVNIALKDLLKPLKIWGDDSEKIFTEFGIFTVSINYVTKDTSYFLQRVIAYGHYDCSHACV